jgi:LysM repeat protein
MNTLKNILFFGLLLAVLCGVYLSLNRPPEPTLPPGLNGDTRPPKIEIPGLTGPPVTTPIYGSESSNPPSFPPQPPPMNAPPANVAGTAPPFPSPIVPPSNIAPPYRSGSTSDPMSGSPPADPAASLDRNYPPGVRNPLDPRTVLESRLSPPPVDSLPPPAEHASSTSLDLIMQQVRLKVGENRLADALLILSQLYGSPDVPLSQAREVTQILDQMAAKVIYSREHLLESPYLVAAGDSLDSIADRCQVPALLLARINGIRDPRNLPPGKEIKVLKGPFSAYISTDHSEMTLMLAGRYAGRFNVVLSNDLSRATSLCTVRDKRARTASAGSESGKQWIELGNANGNINMQGTNDTQVTTGRNSRNTIWLSEQDMDDVIGILSVGSRVIIQR